MNILIISDFFPHSFRSHEGIFVWDQIQELAKRHRIVVIAPRVWYPPLNRYRHIRFPVNQVPFFEKKGKIFILRPVFRTLPLIGEWFVPYWVFLKILFALSWFSIPFDLVHAHWAYRAGWWAVLLGKLRRQPVVLTSHGSDVHFWLNEPVKKGRIRRALNQANGVIFISQNLASAAAGAGIRPQKWEVIPNGVRVVPKPLPAQSKFSEKKIVFVGNLFRVKGADRLVEALALLQQTPVLWQADFIGDGPEREALEGRVKALQLEERVRFLGRQPSSGVQEKLSKADVLVIPSRHEGGPLVLIEALALGKTVVAFDVGIVTDVLNRPELGYVVKNQSAEALAEAIGQALRHPVQPELARRRALEFRLEALVPKVEAFYNQVLQKTKSGTSEKK